MIAVVTGGSRGIGEAVMREMTARGYDCRDLSRTSGYDVGDESSVNRFFGELERLDVLVNNAAVLELASIVDMKVETWDEIIRVDLRGAFLCSQAAFRLMAPGGTIVNVSSLSGVFGTDKFPKMSAYVAAKSGLAGLLSRSMAANHPSLASW